MSEFAFVSNHILSQFSAIPVTGEESVPHLCANLDWGSGSALVAFSGTEVSVGQDTHITPDFTILLADFQTLQALFSGSMTPMQAFSEGQLRSDGYIVWTFRLLMAVCQSPS